MRDSGVIFTCACGEVKFNWNVCATFAFKVSNCCADEATCTDFTCVYGHVKTHSHGCGALSREVSKAHAAGADCVQSDL